jgi:hypothetical protein
MKRLTCLAVLVALDACSESPTQPDNMGIKTPSLTVLTPPGVNLLTCREGTGVGSEPDGTCTLSADHKKAVLANTSLDADGDVSIVFSEDPEALAIYGEFLTNITELSYTYKSLNVPALAPTPGVLSYEIPIDAGGDGTFDFWAYIDAAYCGVKPGATVNIVTMANCGIYTDIDGPHANWAAFVAAYPGARVDNTSYWIMIVSARVPGAGPNSWQISNVKVGKTGLICFDGPSDGTLLGGDCTLGKDFKSATLDNNDAGGGYAGFYSRETTGYGLFLANIHDLSFKYKGSTPQPGELSYQIPISNNYTGSTDFTAIVDVAGCPGTLGGSGVRTVNITKDLSCGIFDGSTTWGNWAAFAAAYPNAKTATDHSCTDRKNWIMMIARRDVGGATSFTLTDIKWGAKGK